MASPAPGCRRSEFPLDPVHQLEVEVEVAPEEVDRHEQVLATVGQVLRRTLSVVESCLEVGDVLLEGAHALARDLFAHQVADEQAEQGVALERSEGDRGGGVLLERLESLVGQRVDRALAGLAGLLARLEVAELG